MTNKNTTLHQQAENLREQDQPLEALNLYQELIIAYQKEKNYPGLVEAMMGSSLVYKHLFLSTLDISFAFISKHLCLASLEIIKHYDLKDRLFRCLFRLGAIEMLFNNYSQAVDYYTDALKNYQTEDAEKGDILCHLGEAQFKLGLKDQAKQNLLDGITQIKKYQSVTDPYVYRVWSSGAYMSLAESIYQDSADEAKQYLQKAQDIIDTDSRLIIRKRQAEELVHKLSISLNSTL